MYATKVREEMTKSNEDLANIEENIFISNQKRQSLPSILPRRHYIRPCCQPRNIPPVHLERFNIKLEEKDACFAPGDVIAGSVYIIASTIFNENTNKLINFQKCSHSSAENDDALHINKLMMLVSGSARMKEENKQNIIKYKQIKETFLFMEANLLVNEGSNELSATAVRAGEVKTIKFKIRLPQRGLLTSLESKSVSVLYTVQLELLYKNNKNEEELKAKTICGFTVVDCFDLARMPRFYFQPYVQHIVKKFGLFSCTGGQIRLHFSINRVAFVGGENIVIEGKIDNRTDRRVDKVAAKLQQLVVINSENQNKNSDLTDVNDINEDSLALFVDPGSTSYALDGSDPETCYAVAATTEGNKFITNRKISIELINKCKRRNSAQQPIINEKNIENKERFININYQLCIFVTTDGVDSMEVNVPIIIGSLPQRKLRFLDAVPPLTDIKLVNQNTFTKAAIEAAIFSENGEGKDLVKEKTSMVLFMPNRKELNFTNKYPFYVNLPTSSKQSRKASIIANSVRAENSLRERQSTIGEENEEINFCENNENKVNVNQNEGNKFEIKNYYSANEIGMCNENQQEVISTTTTQYNINPLQRNSTLVAVELPDNYLNNSRRSSTNN
uniref:Arrestin_C domain-containing protein n=1 Tax=Meloidogyne hapla TaxID=6305 RepID=A0A1I8AYQ4_MELHA